MGPPKEVVKGIFQELIVQAHGSFQKLHFDVVILMNYSFFLDVLRHSNVLARCSDEAAKIKHVRVNDESHGTCRYPTWTYLHSFLPMDVEWRCTSHR